MKKFLSLLLTLTMLLSLSLPATAFAATADNVSSVESVGTVLKSFTAGTGNYQAIINQDESNYTDVTVQFPNLPALLAGGVTKASVDVTMTYDGNVTEHIAVTKDLTNIRNRSFAMKFPNYGNFSTTITYYAGNAVVKTVTTKVDIVADEYNIAPLVATFPVVLFSLQLQNINVNANGDPIPTFVSLQRPDAYNWDKLPANVYWQPNLTKKQVETQTSFATKVAKFKDYVKSLYVANPNAKFHLYINDAYSKYILQLMCANGIPESNYDAVLLSDGAGSYGGYNRTFNVADPQTKYNEMKAGWAAAKAYAYANGNYSLDAAMVPYYGSSNYAVVVANEDANVSWWVARKSDTFIADQDPLGTFRTTYIINSTKVIAKNITSMLTALTEEQKAIFKALYDFNDQMFAKATDEGKKVMMILGSRVNTEPTWGTFSAYAKFLMTQYGDEEYVYYYKGHPATPTSMYPAKQAELDALGIIDVESSIPAELILFFYPDLYMAGYTSSTYNSVSNPNMAAGVFGKNKTEAAADPSLAALTAADAFSFYMDGPWSNTPTASGGIPVDVSAYPGCDSTHENYIINFNAAYLTSQGNLYDVAIYDYTDDMVYYYDQVDTTYTLTKVALGSVSGVSSIVSMKALTTTVSWNPISMASSYQIQYKTRYDADWKTTTATMNSKTFSMLKGQTFEFRVRPCIEINDTKYYGDWSDTTYRFANSTIIGTTMSMGKMALTCTWNKVYSTGKTVAYQLNVLDNGVLSTYTTSDTSKVIKPVVTGHTYAVKVRPIVSVAGKTYIGAYSNTSLRFAANTAITKATSPSKGSVSLTVQKFSTATGYDIVYSATSSFTTYKHLMVKGASTINTLISGLGSDKTYYFKVRPYKIIDGKTYYGAFTPVSSVLVK
jgi:hypothetical protein